MISNKSEEKSRKWRFAAFFLFTNLLIFFILINMIGRVESKTSSNDQSNDAFNGNSEYMMINKQIQAYMSELDSISTYYNRKDIHQNDSNKLSYQKKIADINSYMDSINKENGDNKASYDKDVNQLIKYYKNELSSLINHSMITFQHEPDTAISHEKLKVLQKELIGKDEALAISKLKIQELTKELEKRSNNSYYTTLKNEMVSEHRDLDEYRPARGEGIEDLKQRNTNLRLAYNTLLTQNGIINKAYHATLAENQRLISQINTLRKNSGN